MKILTFKRGTMFTNCYFVIDEDNHCVIIDAGGDAEFFINKLADKNLTPDYILLTHGHFDHIMAIGDLQTTLRVPVYIHRLDAECLINPDISYMRSFAGIDKPFLPADCLLDDGDLIPFGKDHFEVVHTPGHTEGSVTYKIATSLFTGDTLFAGSAGRCDLYGGDHFELMRSLNKLKSLEGDYRVYPGHGSSSSLQNERLNNVFMK